MENKNTYTPSQIQEWVRQADGLLVHSLDEVIAENLHFASWLESNHPNFTEDELNAWFTWEVKN